MYVYIFYQYRSSTIKKREKCGVLVGTYFEDYSVDMTVFYFLNSFGYAMFSNSRLTIGKNHKIRLPI